jgi:SOS-response transcriptional repressor LexA
MSKTKPVRPQYLALGRRIKALMDAHRFDQSFVARRLGIEPQSVQQWVRGQTAPRGYRIEALAALLEVEPWKLLGTSGSTSDSAVPPHRDEGASRALGAGVDDSAGSGPGFDTHIRRVPRLSWVSAGLFREMEAAAHPAEWDTPSEPMSAQAFSLRVEGDSMEPEFPHGCVIFVEPCGEALNGDFVVVALDETHRATFKELVVDGPSRYLKPLNSRYPILPLAAEARVCGVVREMRKAYRRSATGNGLT